jgi:hypothetical protein
MAKRALHCCSVAAVAIVVAACSSAPPAEHGLAPSFRARANAVCAPAAALSSAHPFPLKSFDVHHPDPSALPLIADYFSRYGGGASVARGLDALGDPPSHVAEWHQLLNLIHATNDNAAAQIAADRKRDIAAFESTANRTNALTRQIDQLGAKLGFTPSDECARVFGSG